jgi:ATP-dependent Lon protease
MAASRWHSNMIDLFDWISDNDSALFDLFMPPIFPQIGKKKEEEKSDEESVTDELMNFPDVLPILPLRGVVVYPQTAVPLTVGQPRSIKLVDEVVAADKLVGSIPGWDDCHGASIAESARRHHPFIGAGYGALSFGRVRI